MEEGCVLQLIMRNYKRKTEQRPLTQALYDQAMEMIKKGESIRQAAKSIGFSDTALRKRMKAGKGGPKLGRFRAVFSKEQEQDLVQHCVELDKRFFGLNLKSLRYLLFTYAQKNNIQNPFSNTTKMAGEDFTKAFMQRNRLSLRTPRKTSVARTMGFNKSQLDQYFNNLQEILTKYQFPPQRIYNMDETGIQTVPNKIPKLVAPTGKREVGKSVSAEQGKTITLVCAMSATGHFLPPFFIFGRKRDNRQLIKGGPIGSEMALTEKGYMNSVTFVKWLGHFVKHVNPTEESPVLLILDNHIFHISLPAVSYAKSNNIHMLTLPPHSSHKTQPLDRNFFRPFKAFYDSAADDWITSNPGQTITEFEVAGLVKTAFEKAATVEKAVQGFRCTGIHPLDKNRFTDEDFLPSEVTDQEPAEEHDADELKFVVFYKDPASVPEIESNVGDPASLDAENSAEPSTPEHLGRPSDSEDQADGTSSELVQVGASPEDIIPIPRIRIKRKRTGKGLKSTLITSTPNKTQLEEDEKLKTEKEKVKAERKRLQNLKKVNKAMFSKDICTSNETAHPIPSCSAIKSMQPVASSSKSTQPKSKGSKKILSQSSTSDSDSYSVHNSSSDLDHFLLHSSEEEDEQERSSRNLVPNEFALVKVQGKTKMSMRLYVAKILLALTDGFNVLFYKRIPGTQRFSETEEEAFVDNKDIFMALSKPKISSSGRFINTISFTDDLNGITIY